MTEPRRPRGGRPRDAGLTDRILDEALRVISADGVAALRVEQLASAVGCGKAAVYRRFGTPGELIAAALARVLPAGGPIDTGDVVEDLLALNGEITDTLLAPDRKPESGGMLSAMLDPDVRPHLWDRYFASRRTRAREIIARGRNRGQVGSDIDADDVIDALSGYSLYRASLRGDALDDAHTRRVLQLLLGASPDAPLPPPSESRP
ncbi:MAG: TetR/AcrR family transcriptional regulator [Microbacterium sp.]